jgi:hypothetical protein
MLFPLINLMKKTSASSPIPARLDADRAPQLKAASLSKAWPLNFLTAWGISHTLPTLTVSSRLLKGDNTRDQRASRRQLSSGAVVARTLKSSVGLLTGAQHEPTIDRPREDHIPIRSNSSTINYSSGGKGRSVPKKIEGVTVLTPATPCDSQVFGLVRCSLKARRVHSAPARLSASILDAKPQCNGNAHKP